MTTYRVTNEKLFSKKVSDIDLSGLTSTNNHNGYISGFMANGNISIYLSDGDQIESTGQHSDRDFEDEYGFILECND